MKDIDSEKIFENYLAAGITTLEDPIEEQNPDPATPAAPATGGTAMTAGQAPAPVEQPQQQQPAPAGAQAAGQQIDYGTVLGEMVASNPKILEQIAQIPAVQQMLQGQMQQMQQQQGQGPPKPQQPMPQPVKPAAP